MANTATAAPAVKQQRKYTFHNRVPIKVVSLTKFEKGVEDAIKETIPFLAEMGNHALPFLIGTLVTKHPLSFSEDGHVRKRLLKTILTRLESLGKVKFSDFDTRKFPLGQGRVSV